ncbi:hypothetical protein [Piscirickettsia litoralis]|uniref:Uncharacterized protein n=1 Tax=Piscirickettsia litoralis TaxID=1891921 RepID=A0ABX2ZYV8_9GAMM|nr:hypothetical protein [Piscirickettsia litoralis]ODN41197.1 hypothetical protein BGC07_17440 [Piscirickettsia litoralis]
MSNDIQNSAYFQLDSTDIRDLEVMLGMLESHIGQSIPAISRILKKLDTPISQYRIVKTGLSSAKSVRLN